MLAVPRAASLSSRLSIVRHLVLSVETHRPVEFVDLTAAISAAVQGLTLLDGIVTVQTRHTTTGILVNEHEPLLLEDLEAMFERLAPASSAYAHDDPARRSVNLGPEERRNGHAHCRAALLRASESVPVSGGALTLGRWQRVFLVDFDGGQRRQISLTLMGEVRGPGS
ncbi:MAG TPA: secondary thiamine-phosphate synthase enzyme YjbQ [Vicinamibacterales bacterium]|jgi:secondary thiamine-phosphate synthase enzyme|nr:secondary thiamine-phosphate synthase enzyme YjbQ [Vicinamibacterales bacterium]